MYRQFLVPVTGSAGDAAAIETAVALAGQFDARLQVLQMLALPMPSPNGLGLMPDVTAGAFYGELRAQGELALEKRKAALAKTAIVSEVQLVECLFVDPTHMAAHHAHYADLSVVSGGGEGPGDTATALQYVSALLLESGRPVLVVPPKAPALAPLRRVLLAWRPTAEAARALHDAMPFLKRADQVDVAVVDPFDGERGDGQAPGADIAALLARHEVRANVVVRESGGRRVGEVLLEMVRQMPAQLVVAGGYGHSRLRERIMGGVTRDLLAGSPVPVLFSH